MRNIGKLWVYGIHMIYLVRHTLSFCHSLNHFLDLLCLYLPLPHPFILSLIEPLSLFTLLIFTPSPFHLVLVTWQDLLNSVQDPFEVLTWEHYELYRHELMNIVGVHEIFFGPPSNVIIPEFFDMSVGNGE